MIVEHDLLKCESNVKIVFNRETNISEYCSFNRDWGNLFYSFYIT